MHDPWNLQRFVDAQMGVYDAVVDELQQGRKASHWMWFVFPQLRGLGRSATAQHFGLASLDEALAYLAHPLLGARLRECMTLFAHAAPDEPVFAEALQQYFEGPDARTEAMLRVS